MLRAILLWDADKCPTIVAMETMDTSWIGSGSKVGRLGIP